MPDLNVFTHVLDQKVDFIINANEITKKMKSKIEETMIEVNSHCFEISVRFLHSRFPLKY